MCEVSPTRPARGRTRIRSVAAGQAREPRKGRIREGMFIMIAITIAYNVRENVRESSRMYDNVR